MDKQNQDSIRNESNQKMMTLSVCLLIIAWFFVVCFHVYVRCFGRRPVHTLHHHHIGGGGGGASAAAGQGLDFRVVNSIPTFIYKRQEPPLECAVCLSEFEDDETGRVMPDCKHCFHVGCIDMWLQSHCDCPLCRTRVRVHGVRDPVREPVENPRERIVSVRVPEDTGSGAGYGLHFYIVTY